MAEVGVLELKIKDNSEQAAGGIGKLADALRGIKGAVGKGIGLSPVATSIETLATKVNASMGVIKQITALFNALSGFGKLKDFTINTQQFADLKDAINGMTIGQTGVQLNKMREAFSQKWNSGNITSAVTDLGKLKMATEEWQGAGATSVITSMANSLTKLNTAVSGAGNDGAVISGLSTSIGELSASVTAAGGTAAGVNEIAAALKGMNTATAKTGTSATNIQAVADSIKNLSAAMTEASALAGGNPLEAVTSQMQSAQVSLGDSTGAGYIEGIKNKTSEVASATAEMAKVGIDALANEQESHSPSEKYKYLGQMAGEGFVEGIKSTMNEAANAAKELTSGSYAKVKELVSAFKEVDKLTGGTKLKEYGAGLRSIASASEKGANSYHTIKYLATAISKLKDALSGFRIPDFGKLITLAQALQENYNAGEALKKMAAGMEAIKAAGEGFKMPNTKGLEKIVTAMESGAAVMTATTGKSSGVADMAEAAAVPMQQVVTSLQETETGMQEIQGEASETGKRIEEMIGTLNTPIDHSNIQAYMDQVTGVSRDAMKSAEESAAAFAAPAMDKNGPFEYASDEILHYTEMIKKAESDMQFWSDKYDKISKEIKYKGASDERNSELGHAEQGFDAASAQMTEYENKINEVKEYVSALAGEMQKTSAAVVESTVKMTESQKSYNDLCEEAIQKAHELSMSIGEKYDKRQLREPADLGSGDFLSRSLLGQEGPKTQVYAIQAEAYATGQTIEQVQQRIDEFTSRTAESARSGKQAVHEETQEFRQLEEEIARAMVESADSGDVLESKLDLLKDKVMLLKASLAEKIETGDDSELGITNLKLQIKNIEEQIEKLETIKQNAVGGGGPGMDTSFIDENVSKIDLLISKYNMMKETLREKFIAGEIDAKGFNESMIKLETLREKIEKLQQKEAKVNAPIDPKAFEEANAAVREHVSMVEMLESKYNILADKLASGLAKGEVSPEQFVGTKIQLEKLYEQIEKLKAEEASLGESNGLKVVAEDARMVADSFLRTNDKLSLLRQQIDALKTRLGNGISSGTMGEGEINKLAQQLQNLIAKYQKLIEEQEKASSASGKVGSTFAKLKTGIKAMFPHLTNLAKQFKRLATRMMLRSVLRQITSGFREGVKNVYMYSKAVGTDLAPSMDSAATSLLQMKNSIGAAVSPLIQSLVPVLKQVANWFITLMNYANQFFSMLSGKSTWTRAVEYQTTAYEDNAKAAKAASGAANDWLADFDELNVIPTEGGGGGGGSSSTTPDYEEMFEEVAEFDGKIKEIVGWIKENMDLIKAAAIAIGAAILAWKISSAFADSMSSLQKLSLAAGIALVITGVTLGYSAGFDIGYSNSNDSLLKAVGGVLSSTAGGALIGASFGGAHGALIGAAAGFVVGLGATVVGYIKGVELRKAEEKAEAIRIKWGGVTYTKEQLEEYIESMFEMDINPVINVLDPYVTTAKSDTMKLMDKGSLLQNLLKKRAMEVAYNIPITVSMDDIVNAANDVITSLNESEESSLNLLKITLSVSELTGADGKPLDASSLLSTISVGEQNLIEYMAELGRKMRQAYEGELTPGIGQTSDDLARAYAEEILYISMRAKQLYEEEKLNFELNVEFNFDDMSLDSAIEMMKLQREKWAEKKNEFIEQRKDSIFTFMKRKNEQEATLESYKSKNANGEYDRQIKEAEDTIAAYDSLINSLSNWEADWEKLILPTRTAMVQKWVDLLKSKGVVKSENAQDFIDYYNNVYLSWKGHYKDSAIANTRRMQLYNSEEGYEEFLDMAKLYGMSDFELMSPENRAQSVAYLLQTQAGNDLEKTKEILKSMGMSNAMITQAISEYESLMPDIIKEAVKQGQDTYDDWVGRGSENAMSLTKRDLKNYMPEYLVEYVLSQIKTTNPVAPLGPDKDKPFGYLNEFAARYAAEIISNNPSLPLDEVMEFVEGLYGETLAKEIEDYINTNGVDALLQDLEEYYDLSGSKRDFNKNNAFANAGAADVGPRGFYAPSPENGFARTEGESTTTAVANGTRQGTTDIMTSLGVVQSLLRSILAATGNTKVTVVPTSALARGVVAGAALYNNVTGND